MTTSVFDYILELKRLGFNDEARAYFNGLPRLTKDRFFDYCQDLFHYDAADADCPDFMEADIYPFFLSTL